MNFLYEDGPIIACSTPTSSNGAIGVLRLSGFSQLRELQEFLSRSLEDVPPRKVFFTNILDGLSNHTLDQALGVFFEAPYSYSGENVLELSVHGNQLNIQQLLHRFTSTGKIRQALPGEFTYRALKNKKMTLSQVEGLDLILNGSSTYMLSQGQALINGELQDSFIELQKIFLRLRTALELNIDFLEDVGEDFALSNLMDSFSEFNSAVQALYRRTGGPLGAGIFSPTIVLAGPTNAGKSSLFNELLRMNRSIVSPLAGTTRDYVSESILIQDVCFRLIDTAGVREAGNEVERQGITRSLELISKAFFKILVINPLDLNEQEGVLDSLKDVEFDLAVFSHFDKIEFIEGKRILGKLPYFKNEMSASLVKSEIGPTKVSGPIGPALKTGGPIGPVDIKGPQEAMEKNSYIERTLYLVSEKYTAMIKDNPIIVERHRHLIKELSEKVMELKQLFENDKQDMGILSHEMLFIGNLVSQLIGVASSEDLLAEVFSNFCIGK